MEACPRYKRFKARFSYVRFPAFAITHTECSRDFSVVIFFCLTGRLVMLIGLLPVEISTPILVQIAHSEPERSINLDRGAQRAFQIITAWLPESAEYSANTVLL